MAHFPGLSGRQPGFCADVTHVSKSSSAAAAHALKLLHGSLRQGSTAQQSDCGCFETSHPVRHDGMTIADARPPRIARIARAMAPASARTGVAIHVVQESVKEG